MAPWVEDRHPLDDTVNRTTVYDDPLKVYTPLFHGARDEIGGHTEGQHLCEK